MPRVGELEIIYSPATGEVQWYKADGGEVGPDDEILGVVIDKDGEPWNIRNPLKGKGAKGILIILPKAVPLVGIGNPIAVIRITAILYASKINR